MMGETDLLHWIRYNTQGLVPAIAQQHDTGEILMMAWMNAGSLQETLEAGRVCYWSRSRQTYWRKGDTSGHHQYIVECMLGFVTLSETSLISAIE